MRAFIRNNGPELLVAVGFGVTWIAILIPWL
jgi:hypothetical protein